MAKIYRVIQIKLNPLVSPYVLAWLLACYYCLRQEIIHMPKIQFFGF